MRVVFLGTSGSMPTTRRSSSSVVVRLGRDLMMFDCGEGTQRQMVRARVGFRRNMKIFLTHLHGDHVLGLPGLLQTMSLLRRERQLDVYGPIGTVEYVKAFSETLGGPTFPVIIHEILEPSVVYSDGRLEVVAVKSSHRVESWSYGLIEKPRPGRFHPDKAKSLGVPEGRLWHALQHGEAVTVEGRTVEPTQVSDPPRSGRRIVISGDTRPYPEMIELAGGADLLIHEATFSHDLQERAEEDGHTTAREAAEVAKEAGAKMLALIHISSRYFDPGVLLEEAKQVYKNVFVAEDLMEIELPLSR